MSQRFYDENLFFSGQMLFGRYEDESVVMKELFPAFRECVRHYVDWGQRASRERCAEEEEVVKERVTMYDTYSAHRDPAHGLLKVTFGEEWADEFVFGFLFDRSDRNVRI